MIEPRSRIILFGTGKGGQNGFLHLCDSHNIIAFVDNDPQKQGKTLYGLPVLAPTEGCKLDYEKIIICSMHHEAIRQQLVNDFHVSERVINALQPRVLVRSKNFGVDLLARLQSASNTEYHHVFNRVRQRVERYGGVERFMRLFRIAIRYTGWMRKSWAVHPAPCLLDEWIRRVPELEWTYNILDDELSCHLLVELIAFRILGDRHIRLPLATPEYRQQRAALNRLANWSDTITAPWSGISATKELPLYDLSSIGFPVTCYISSPFTQFAYEQYCCAERDIVVQESDCVIDAGACWGDSALYFACKASNGEVHSFEFDQGNLAVFDTNMKRNPVVGQRITLTKQPLWSSSCMPMFVKGSGGPGSRVKSASSKEFTTQVKTITIDDYVEKSDIKKVDFIKMDIEGAEEEALLGARNTIRKMHPKLAICVYHKPDDLYRIPKLIENLCPDYRFYLKHASTHEQETVLLAKYNG